MYKTDQAAMRPSKSNQRVPNRISIFDEKDKLRGREGLATLGYDSREEKEGENFLITSIPENNYQDSSLTRGQLVPII